MRFFCFTDREPCAGLTAPDIIGSPLTAASWYLDTLPAEERAKVGSIEVFWNDGEEQRQAYGIVGPAARLVAL